MFSIPHNGIVTYECDLNEALLAADCDARLTYLCIDFLSQTRQDIFVTKLT